MNTPIQPIFLADKVKKYKQEQIAMLRRMLSRLPTTSDDYEIVTRKEEFYKLVQFISISFQTLENNEILTDALFEKILLTNSNQVEHYNNPQIQKDVYHIHG